MTTTFPQLDIRIKDVKTKKYRLMYLFGAWVPASTIYAESDDEAIADAIDDFNNMRRSSKLQYALFCGNRLVKSF